MEKEVLTLQSQGVLLCMACRGSNLWSASHVKVGDLSVGECMFWLFGAMFVDGSVLQQDGVFPQIRDM